MESSKLWTTSMYPELSVRNCQSLVPLVVAFAGIEYALIGSPIQSIVLYAKTEKPSQESGSLFPPGLPYWTDASVWTTNLNNEPLTWLAAGTELDIVTIPPLSSVDVEPVPYVKVGMLPSLSAYPEEPGIFPALDLHCVVEELDPVDEISVHETPLLFESSIHALSQPDPSRSQ